MSTPTLPEQESRRERLAAPALVATGVLAASVLLHVRDPHEAGSYGFCPWLVLTGTYCPGCGGLRAVNDLTHGEIRAAASSNLLFVGVAPLLMVWWSHWFARRWRGIRPRASSRRVVGYAIVFGAVALAFTVLRNLSVGAWLAP